MRESRQSLYSDSRPKILHTIMKRRVCGLDYLNYYLLLVIGITFVFVFYNFGLGSLEEPSSIPKDEEDLISAANVGNGAGPKFAATGKSDDKKVIQAIRD